MMGIMINALKKQRGFTIVELLIVIVIIAILAVITIVAYNGMQDRARISKVNGDISSLVKAMHIARNSANSTLLGITGNGCTRCACPYTNGDTTDYSTLPKTHSCWTSYVNTINKIALASGINLDSVKDGDPWGAPYAIDENEGENGACNYDSIWSFGKSRNANGGTNVGNKTLSHYGPLCT